MKISIVIPVYNEERTIKEIVGIVHAASIGDGNTKEIIIVNDCSQDKTGEVLESLHNETVRVFHHSVNLGKGAALRTGFSHASGDIILIQDADLEYDPSEYLLLLEPILHDKADVVFGSRFISNRPHRVLYFWHSIGNQFLTLLSNMVTNLNISDMETCYKVFKSSVLKFITIEENRFGFEPEITCKIAKIPEIRIFEVGISYYGRTYAEGKKIGWKDGFRAIWCIVKYGVLR